MVVGSMSDNNNELAEVFTVPPLSPRTPLGLCSDYFWLSVLPNWQVQSEPVLGLSEQRLGLRMDSESDSPGTVRVPQFIRKISVHSKDRTLDIGLH
jgi:hypothetical protein